MGDVPFLTNVVPVFPQTEAITPTMEASIDFNPAYARVSPLSLTSARGVPIRSHICA
jgi:hypothetical protein